VTTAPALPTEALQPAGSRHAARGVVRVYRAEVRKLSSQILVRVIALLCLVVPFIFAALLKVQSGSPTDTLYGVWVHSSGFAVSLVVLASAGSWGCPLIAGAVAGDLFSSEDRYGTWKLVLTRSCTRGDLFVGKLLAAATFSVALVLLTALSSIAAGLILVGAQPLVNLNGTLFSPSHSLALVFVSWLVCIPPTLALTSIAVLLSIATRNGIVGVIGPFVAALAMQLLLLVGTGIWAHLLLVGSAFSSWHGLFAAHPGGDRADRDRGQLGPGGRHREALALDAEPGVQPFDRPSAARAGTARSGQRQAHPGAADLQPPRQHSERARGLGVHDLRGHAVDRRAAVPADSGRLRRERAVGRVLQGTVAAGFHRSAADAQPPRSQRRKPALHDLRLLQPAVRSAAG
jgi:ABC-2 type transport system permease protein